MKHMKSSRSMKSMSMKDDMSCAKHKMWKGLKMLVLGAIVLLNVYQPFAGWWTLIGLLLIILGFSKLIMPSCCNGNCSR